MTDEEKKERPMKKEISRADLLKELLPGLNALFGQCICDRLIHSS
jgi:hypothetical protein